MSVTAVPNQHGLARKPLLTIKPSSRWVPVDLRELWQYRDLFVTLAERDVRVRYRQTALGVLWVVLQPLFAAGVLSFFFNRIAKLPTAGVPPFLFTMVGMLAWGLFNNTLTRTSNSLLQNQMLVSKVFFPRMILPLSTVMSAFIDFIVTFVLVLILMAAYHVHLTIALLYLPLWTLVILLWSIGIGLFLSALTVSYRDVIYILPVITQVLLYAMPVVYPASFVAARLHSGAYLYYLLNPLAPLIEAFRWSLIGSGHIAWGYVAYACGLSIVLCIAGAYVFRSMERRFADVI